MSSLKKNFVTQGGIYRMRFPENEGIFQKRAKRLLPISIKIEILDQLASGEGSSAIARKYGLNESTVRTLKKRESRIRASAAMNSAMNSKISGYLRDSGIEAMEDELNTWIQERKIYGENPDGNRIREKARELHKKILENDQLSGALISSGKSTQFAASKGWLAKFKKRFGLTTPKFSGNNSNQASESINVLHSSEIFPSEIPYGEQLISQETTAEYAQRSSTNEQLKMIVDACWSGQRPQLSSGHTSNDHRLFKLTDLKAEPESETEADSQDDQTISRDDRQLTIKDLEKGLHLAECLQEHFTSQDPSSERISRFKADLRTALGPYKQLYDNLKSFSDSNKAA